MSEMIERMARAMAMADDEDYMESAAEYDRRARVALIAARIATDAMQIAAATLSASQPMTTYGDLFTAMVDEALKP